VKLHLRSTRRERKRLQVFSTIWREKRTEHHRENAEARLQFTLFSSTCRRATTRTSEPLLLSKDLDFYGCLSVSPLSDSRVRFVSFVQIHFWPGRIRGGRSLIQSILGRAGNLIEAWIGRTIAASCSRREKRSIFVGDLLYRVSPGRRLAPRSQVSKDVCPPG